MHWDQLFRAHLGIVPRTLLRREGASAHLLRRLVAEGRLLALNRSLVALPSTRPEYLRAVRMGGSVSCVTAAALRGIWVVDDGRFHVASRRANSHLEPDGAAPLVVAHWTRRPVDPSGNRLAIESGRDMLARIAGCQPLDFAVAAFDSAVRKKLISLDELRLLAERLGGRFRAVVALVSELADSGLESIARVRLGFAGIPCREQVVIDEHPVDLLIGTRLIVQLDGRQHGESAQLARDRRQDRRLRRMGYTVLRYDYADVVHHWDRTLAEIGAVIALGLHERPGPNPGR